ncbi:MAG: sigma-70 family RNA polymerase sigma factor [Verrucomicrobiales bacterium]|nr:sigma-70 family RNA polymerase sigma factor [Verrucomicrobiales bacterium]
MNDITGILDRAQQGDPAAAGELLPLVYEELRRLAAHRLAAEAPGQTLQPTALVHEAWLRLVGNDHNHWNGRGHFFGAAAEAMRRILIENARRKHRAKRGGQFTRVDLDSIDVAATCSDDQVLAVDEALGELAKRDPRAAELVKLRFYLGLSSVEAAEAVDLPERTAKRTLAYARAWLYERLKQDAS